MKLTNTEIKQLVSAIEQEPTLKEDGSFDGTVSSLARYNAVFGSSLATKHLSEAPELLRDLGIQPALVTNTDIENLVNMSQCYVLLVHNTGSCIRTGVQVRFRNNYLNQITVTL